MQWYNAELCAPHIIGEHLVQQLQLCFRWRAREHKTTLQHTAIDCQAKWQEHRCGVRKMGFALASYLFRVKINRLNFIKDCQVPLHNYMMYIHFFLQC